MITIWKQEEETNKLYKVEKFQRNCWIDISNPTPDEISMLKRQFKVPEDFINDILDIDERSRTELEGRWLLLILRVPVYIHGEDIPYYTIPLGVLISQSVIITVCLYENSIVHAESMQRHYAFSITNRHNFVLILLLRSANFYLKYLKEINRQSTLVEKELRKATKNSELTKLLKLEKCLVYFTTSLKSNELLIAKLQRSKLTNINEVDEDLLEDVMIEIKQASEMANIHRDILSGLMGTFASVISNNVNNVMKQLTLITIVLMIPTLISSFFGMNMPNAMEQNPYAIYYVLGISILASLFGVYIFRRRNWF